MSSLFMFETCSKSEVPPKNVYGLKWWSATENKYGLKWSSFFMFNTLASYMFKICGFLCFQNLKPHTFTILKTLEGNYNISWLAQVDAFASPNNHCWHWRVITINNNLKMIMDNLQHWNCINVGTQHVVYHMFANCFIIEAMSPKFTASPYMPTSINGK